MSNKPVKFGEQDASDDIPRRSAQLGNPGYHIDVNYIPGYTEQVLANDMAKAIKTDSTGMSEETKQGYYQRFGRKPMPLPYHFMPLRVLNTANEPLYGNQQLMNFQRLGYRPAKAEDFKEDGIFGRLGWQKPPAYQETPGGTFRNWDTELWFVDGDRYRYNEAQRAEQTKQMANTPKLPDSFKGPYGSAPTFELEPKTTKKPLQTIKE
jgi:hypothetical protein